MVRMAYVQHLTRITIVRMKMPAVTGISKKVYDLLFERPLLSLEIKSADNISALLEMEKGQDIFVTPLLRDDLFAKGDGCICEIREKMIYLQKVKKWDEAEIVTVRIQVKPKFVGKIKSVEKKTLGAGVDVEVEKAVRCSIS
ncbi:MAG: DUF473 family protein [Theionarchaea archaeon]|nr:DUF473 family protein [Theionarchaea archaeon]